MSGCNPKLIDTDPHVAMSDLNALCNYLHALLKHFRSAGYQAKGWGWKYKITFNKETRQYEARARTYG